MSIDEMIAVLQAAKDGKEIQWRTKGSGNKWSAFSGAALLWDFRVKPGPREFWIAVHAHGAIGGAHFDRATALRCGAVDVIHVREVIDSGKTPT